MSDTRGLPIGTRVRYRSAPGAEPFDTVTRSEVWALGHGERVVKIEGRTGGVCLWALEILSDSAVKEP